MNKQVHCPTYVFNCYTFPRTNTKPYCCFYFLYACNKTIAFYEHYLKYKTGVCSFLNGQYLHSNCVLRWTPLPLMMLITQWTLFLWNTYVLQTLEPDQLRSYTGNDIDNKIHSLNILTTTCISMCRCSRRAQREQGRGVRHLQPPASRSHRVRSRHGHEEGRGRDHQGGG